MFVRPSPGPVAIRRTGYLDLDRRDEAVCRILLALDYRYSLIPFAAVDFVLSDVKF